MQLSAVASCNERLRSSPSSASASFRQLKRKQVAHGAHAVTGQRSARLSQLPAADRWRQTGASFSASCRRLSSMVRLSAPMAPIVRFCASCQTGKCILEHGLALGRQMQTAAATPCRRIHVDVAQRQKPLQVARQRRLLDVEVVADLDGGDAVTRSELRKQSVLARRDAQRAHGVVVDARNDTRQLAHACRKTGARSHLGYVGYAGGLSRSPLQRVCHDVHFCPRNRSWSYNPSDLMPRFCRRGQRSRVGGPLSESRRQ